MNIAVDRSRTRFDTLLLEKPPHLLDGALSLPRMLLNVAAHESPTRLFALPLIRVGYNPLYPADLPTDSPEDPNLWNDGPL